MSGILGMWNSQKLTPWHKMLADLEVLGCDAQGDWHDLELVSSSFVEDLMMVRESSGFVGTTQLYRLLTYAYQMESVSPLVDKPLFEFVLHPPAVLHSSIGIKKVISTMAYDHL